MKSTSMDIVLEKRAEGDIGPDLSIKKSVWTDIENKFREETGSDLDKTQLQTQYGTLKKTYHAYAALADQSGFGRDDDNFCVTADESV